MSINAYYANELWHNSLSTPSYMKNTFKLQIKNLLNGMNFNGYRIANKFELQIKYGI